MYAKISQRDRAARADIGKCFKRVHPSISGHSGGLSRIQVRAQAEAQVLGAGEMVRRYSSTIRVARACVACAAGIAVERIELRILVQWLKFSVVDHKLERGTSYIYNYGSRNSQTVMPSEKLVVRSYGRRGERGESDCGQN